ncbi:unnamed protein product [Ceratitis capitata]|uniref:(Mediterranean fruit fly) hypothetical protein n=1 Tax=Ceratitis capitata TaxID=7213 RepID=A0A811UPE0_CERCA|nr:unnamed protein product [Ceratitis capitata]
MATTTTVRKPINALIKYTTLRIEARSYIGVFNGRGGSTVTETQAPRSMDHGRPLLDECTNACVRTIER